MIVKISDYYDYLKSRLVIRREELEKELAYEKTVDDKYAARSKIYKFFIKHPYDDWMTYRESNWTKNRIKSIEFELAMLEYLMGIGETTMDLARDSGFWESSFVKV